MPETTHERRRARGMRRTLRHDQERSAESPPATAGHRIANVDTRPEPPAAIGYLGLNPKAHEEAQSLRRSSSDRVLVSLNRPGAERRLDSEEEQWAFVEQELEIDPEGEADAFTLALACLTDCDAGFREQMADLMRMFRRAELGRYTLERLVLSGHQAGGTMWGDGRGAGELIPERDLRNVAAAFPMAAAQVHDIMLSACNSTAYVEMCAEIFPSLESVWVYVGTSPSVATGSARHITRWERETRADGLPAEGDRVPTRRDQAGHVVVWTRAEGVLIEVEGRLTEIQE